MRRAALALGVAVCALAFGLVPVGVAQEGGGGQSGLIGVDGGVVTITVPIQFAVNRFPHGGEARRSSSSRRWRTGRRSSRPTSSGSSTTR